MIRDYQEQALKDLPALLSQHRRVVYQLPTGGGKTIVGATAAQRFLNMATDRRCWFLVHRKELLDQSFKKICELGIRCGRIGAGYTAEPWHRMQVASVQSLVRRVKGGKVADNHRPGLIIVDEAHHTTANTYQMILDEYPEAFVLGLTATPERHDGTGLDTMYKAIYPGPTVTQLIGDEWLARPRCYARKTEVAKVSKMKFGEFDQKLVGEAAGRSIAETMAAIKEHAADRKGVVFCASIKHSREVTERLRGAGLDARHLDGDTSRDERDQTIKSFRDGRVKWICNHSIISEGFDCPDAQVAVLARPTMSLAVYLQMVGRVMRPGDGKMVLDLAGNIMRHGMPDMDREWSLAGREKQARDPAEQAESVWICLDCFMVNKVPAQVCAACHAPKPASEDLLQEREEELAEIKEVLPQTITRPKENALGYALRHRMHTIEQLREVARMYNFSPGWANKVQPWVRKTLRVA